MASIQVRMEGDGLTYVGDVPREKIGEVLAFLMAQAQGEAVAIGAGNGKHQRLPKEVRKEKSGRKCSNCGGGGHTSRTCDAVAGSGNDKVGSDENGRETEAFDEGTFTQVREALNHHGSSKAVADSLRLPLKEVNRAVRFKYFAWYMKNRLKI